MPVNNHVFRGRRYKIVRRALPDVDGLCCQPDATSKFIMIDKRLTGKRMLEVMIHEAMHACSWDTAEEAVEQSAHDIAAWLWREGYRRINDGTPKR
jgi:hypothetical protein